MKLSTLGITNLPSSKHPNDFEFIVGQRRYSCSSAVAAFLSPKVGHLQGVDPTVDRYVLSITDDYDVFSKVLSLSQGLSVEVTDSTRETLLSIAHELENRELWNLAFGNSPTLNLTNVSQLYRYFKTFNVGSSDIISFIASHFHEMREDFVKSLDCDDLGQILSQSCLVIKSEDDLYEIISSRFAENAAFVELLQFVRFEFLSESVIERFVEFSEKNAEEFGITLSLRVWRAIWRRLILRLDSKSLCLPPDRYAALPGIDIPLREDAPLDGILAYLTKKHSGNLHAKGIVVVTGNITQGHEQLTDPLGTSGFAAWNAADGWFCYDFGETRICPTHYSVMSCCNNRMPQSWTISVSEDGKVWETIHSATDSQTLKSGSKTESYSISQPRKSRFLRFTTPAVNYLGQNVCHMKSFELFGRLIE
jgi:hypothetical protein